MEEAFNNTASDGATAGSYADKLLTITPLAGATFFDITIKYVDTSTKKPVSNGSGRPSAGLSIRVQAGEFEVIRSIVQSSVLYLLGWPPQMDELISRNMRSALSGAPAGTAQ